MQIVEGSPIIKTECRDCPSIDKRWEPTFTQYPNQRRDAMKVIKRHLELYPTHITYLVVERPRQITV